jgi:hypothetical protein
MSHRCNRNFWDRREFLFRSGGGISGLALAYLLDRQGLLTAEQSAPPATDGCGAAAVGVNPYAAKPPHFRRARPRDLLFMGGGWSQVDTFDPKPALAKMLASRSTERCRATSSCGRDFRAAHAQPLHVREVRQSGIEYRSSFRTRAGGRRDRVPALGTGGRTITCRAPTKCRPAKSTWDSQRRIVGDLRPGLGLVSLLSAWS